MLRAHSFTPFAEWLKSDPVNQQADALGLHMRVHSLFHTAHFVPLSLQMTLSRSEDELVVRRDILKNHRLLRALARDPTLVAAVNANGERSLHHIRSHCTHRSTLSPSTLSGYDTSGHDILLLLEGLDCPTKGLAGPIDRSLVSGKILVDVSTETLRVNSG